MPPSCPLKSNESPWAPRTCGSPAMEAMGPGEGVGGGGEGSGEEAGGGLEGGGEGGGAGQEVIVPYVSERLVAWKVHTEAELPTYASPPGLPLLPEKLVVAMDVVPE